MIERFNFYDLYGYFLPGLVFLALIWLPIGITRQFWPGKEITSAIAVLAFAYIVGHILQTVFQNALPSKGKDSNARRRYPSDYFLDSDNETFSAEFRRELSSAVQNRFHIDLKITSPVSDEEVNNISKARDDAFLMARKTLFKSDADPYGEQFEGLYALMRGLAGAFWMGSAYTLGWSLAHVQSRFPVATAYLGWTGLAIAVIVGFVPVFGSPKSETRTILDRITLVSLLIALCGAGMKLAANFKVSSVESFTFMLIFAALFWAGARCFAAYKHFADEFAKTIWIHFLSHQSTAPSQATDE